MKKIQLTKMGASSIVSIRAAITCVPTVISNIKGYKWSQSYMHWPFPYKKDDYALVQHHFNILLKLLKKQERQPILQQAIFLNSSNHPIYKKLNSTGNFDFE